MENWGWEMCEARGPSVATPLLPKKSKKFIGSAGKNGRKEKN